MKRLLFFWAFLALFSCNEDSIEDLKVLEVQDDPSITSLNGTWRVIAYEDLEQGKLITKTEENSRGLDITITFDDTTDPPSIDAKNTTNTIDGNFEYIGRRSIQTSDLFTTLVTQPEWADEFGRIIFGSELQFVVNSSQLKLFDTTEQLNVVLERE